jgi:5'-AMP-activated protein kinase, regulatory gamma subunit
MQTQGTLSPATSPKVRRKPSARRRAGSHIPPAQTQETHDAALHAIRSFLKGHTSYDALPISFRLIVLDTKLNVKKALQCLLLNGEEIIFFSLHPTIILRSPSGVVSAPLWNSQKSRFAGMLTVLDLIHLIQYYYRTASYDTAAADVETFKLESLRGNAVCYFCFVPDRVCLQILRRVSVSQRHRFYTSIHLVLCTTPQHF